MIAIIKPAQGCTSYAMKCAHVLCVLLYCGWFIGTEAIIGLSQFHWNYHEECAKNGPLLYNKTQQSVSRVHNFTILATYCNIMTSSNGKNSALLALLSLYSPVTQETPHKSQWRRALMFSLICAWTNGWANNRNAGDLRRHRAHHGVTVLSARSLCHVKFSKNCNHC